MIYTFYTDTHKTLLDDWFMGTIREKEKVHIEKFDQECESGDFMSKGWNDTMLKKVNYIRECLLQGEPFFHLDCDIQFFDFFCDKYMKIMEDNDLDILAQNDGKKTACCGFMLIKPSDKTIKLFDEVYKTTKDKVFSNDQFALNGLLPNHPVRAMLLGEDCFSVWMSNGFVPWQPRDGLRWVPKHITAHHANWTVGIDDKIKLMTRVRDEYSKQN